MLFCFADPREDVYLGLFSKTVPLIGYHFNSLTKIAFLQIQEIKMNAKMGT